LRSFHCASWDPLPLEEVRLRTFDFYQRLRGRQTVARPVIIVDIDEASLKDIGQWPWPRTIVADLVTQLAQLGAAAIAFDVIFAEPDRMSPSVAATSFRNLDEETRDKLRNLPSNDEVLAEAIRRSHTQNEPNFSQFIEWLAKLRLSAWTGFIATISALKLIAARFAQTLVARVKSREAMLRQNAPGPLSS
jgi:CHASE2 domain-containing sensor protein